MLSIVLQEMQEHQEGQDVVCDIQKKTAVCAGERKNALQRTPADSH
ncbi:MAG: hypothetical protein J6C65_03820 [Prevotella sp.]|nr:hypothetical protein [Prevotella sp.]